MSFQEKIKDYRVNSELTQSEVAIIFGYTTPQFISNWERGCSFPPPAAFRKLIKIYNLTFQQGISLAESLEDAVVDKTIVKFKNEYGNIAKGIR